MKREKEFKQYLEDNNKSLQNVGYCKNHIEKAFGGMDMDDIIISHQNISQVRAKLQKIDKNDGCIDAYMVALNHYLKFAFSYGKMSTLAGTVSTGSAVTAYPSKINVCNIPKVMYCDDVPFSERDENLRRGLEDEYPKILEFAKKIFGVENGYISVYLSKRTPVQKIYKAKKSFLDKLRQKNQNQRELTDLEYRILDTKMIVTDVVARFFPGENPYIEIYYKNLPSKYIRLEKAINCLVHEYMHFIEYVYSVENHVPEFADDKVSEALADFFGVLYSINRNSRNDLEVAKNKYDLWKALDGSGWPYAYALYFYCVNRKEMIFSCRFADYVNHGSTDKLVKVFNATIDVKDAYKKLKKL